MGGIRPRFCSQVCRPNRCNARPRSAVRARSVKREQLLNRCRDLPDHLAHAVRNLCVALRVGMWVADVVIGRS